MLFAQSGLSFLCGETPVEVPDWHPWYPHSRANSELVAYSQGDEMDVNDGGLFIVIR